MNKHTAHYILYHKDCADGMAAAWAFDYLFNDYRSMPEYKEEGYTDTVSYHPVQYGNPHPFNHWLAVDQENKMCYILDFSYSRAEIIHLSTLFARVTILDHHKTAAEALSNWEDKPDNVFITFDMNRSGAGITWDHFSEGIALERPKLVNYVEDRDLWKFKLDKSQEVNAYIALIPKTLEDYQKLYEFLEWNVNSAADLGTILLHQHKKICEDIVLNAQPFSLYDLNGKKHDGLVANCTGHFASDVGNLLAEKSGTFGATWFTDGSGKVKFSLRSIGDYDVSALAKPFGGGGHRNASGFSLSNPTSKEGGVAVWSMDANLQNVPHGGM